MKKILTYLIISVFIISCDNYSYNINKNGYPSEIKIKYSNHISRTANSIQNSYLNNDNVPYSVVVNGRVYGTYKTKINPIDVGYDLSFYNIDTSSLFMCKFIFKPAVSQFDRHIVILNDFKFILKDSTQLVNSKDYIKIMDIITKKAFNELKI